MEVLNHLVMAVYVSIVVYFGMKLISAMTTHTHYTPTLRIPKHYLYFVVCVALALIGIRSILGVYRTIRTARSARGEEARAMTPIVVGVVVVLMALGVPLAAVVGIAALLCVISFTSIPAAGSVPAALSGIGV